jgi:HAD superfamily hydrolase (TIGR01459 family)
MECFIIIINPKQIEALSAIAYQYKGYIIDVWGVLHSGGKIFPHVIECLRALKNKNNSIILLSNAPRRAQSVGDQLNKLGINRELYTHIITSGEAVYQELINRAKVPNTLCYHIGTSAHDHLFYGVNLQTTNNIHQVDFILNSGPQDESAPITIYEDLFKQAIELQLPMICANPDRYVITEDDKRYFCAGSLAQFYEELGGKVNYLGKPYPQVYRMASNLMANIDKAKILAIGDSIPNDIQGAINFGIDSALVISGIYPEITINYSERSLQKGGQLNKVVPTYILPCLKW